jgi:hypothetical protein
MKASSRGESNRGRRLVIARARNILIEARAVYGQIRFLPDDIDPDGSLNREIVQVHGNLARLIARLETA